MRPLNRLSAALAFTACAALAVPAAALELPLDGPGAYNAAAENVQHRRWRRNRDVGAGDVLAGVLILGGIAAIASAANRSRDRVEDYPGRYPYPEDRRYRSGTPGSYQSRGMDRAVEMCVTEVERGRDRIVSVDSAARTGEGWFVSGELEDSAPFTCRIGNDGRISDIDVGDGAYDDGVPDARYDAASVDEQYEDDVYFRARADQREADEEPHTYSR